MNTPIDNQAIPNINEDEEGEETATAALQSKLNTHRQTLSAKQKNLVVAALVLIATLSMCDMIGISIAIPSIAHTLHAEKSIQWTGTVFSISNSIMTVLSGRFSDIFGRKSLLLACIAITGIFELAQGFAQTPTQFYIFRAIDGLGCGAVAPLCMVIVADMATPEERAAYQGMLGSAIGTGSCLGYFIFAGMIQSTVRGWRNGFFLIAPFWALAFVIVWLCVPYSKSNLNKREIIKNMDYFGIMLSSAFLIFLLIPLDSGGILFKWNSVLIIVFFALGGSVLIGFILVEYYFARIPIIPLSIFNSIHVTNMLIQCALYGMVFVSISFYFPFYCLTIREFSSLQTAAYMQCVLLPVAIGGSISGWIISKVGNYNYVIWTGYTLWLASGFALLSLSSHSNLIAVGAILIVLSIGIACTIQPSQQAIQAHTLLENRAVIMATRMSLRYVGNAMGIAASSVIFSQTILVQVSKSTVLSNNDKTYLKQHITSKFKITEAFSDPTISSHVTEIYMKAIKNLIYLWIPLIGICWLLSFFVTDEGLTSKDEKDHDLETCSFNQTVHSS